MANRMETTDNPWEQSSLKQGQEVTWHQFLDTSEPSGRRVTAFHKIEGRLFSKKEEVNSCY